MRLPAVRPRKSWGSVQQTAPPTAPAPRNRRRPHWPRRPALAGYQFEALSLAAAIVILTGLLLAARL